MLKPLALIMAVIIAQPAWAANEKIDPETYICAELITSGLDGQPPIFEGLQLDGYAAAKMGETVADPDSLAPMLVTVADSCSAKPSDKVLARWLETRGNFPYADEGKWRADKTTCADYAADPDDASGFIIWLDGYNRGKTGKKSSIFTDQQTLDAFLNACSASPDKLMLDLLAEKAK